MPQMLIQHKVQDYDKWRTLFDLSLPVRKMFGEKSFKVFRSMEDANDVTVLVDWKDINQAQKFAESEDLQSSLKESGVISTPQIYISQDDIEQ